jgi:hypothetical protein
MCGGVITGRSVEVWMNPVGTRQVAWKLAHPGCAAILDDEADEADDGGNAVIVTPPAPGDFESARGILPWVPGEDLPEVRIRQARDVRTTEAP